jgi:hypothetical protein
MAEVIELQQAEKQWQDPQVGGEQPYSDVVIGERDNRDMYRMGKQQEFRRNFKVISISSFSLATMMGWVFIPMYVHHSTLRKADVLLIVSPSLPEMLHL